MYGGRKGHCKWQIPQSLLYAFRHPRHMALWLVVTDQIPEPPHPLHRDFPVPWGSSCWLPPTYFSTDVAALILSSRSHVFEKYITTRNRRRPSTHSLPPHPPTALPPRRLQIMVRNYDSSETMLVLLFCVLMNHRVFVSIQAVCIIYVIVSLQSHGLCQHTGPNSRWIELCWPSLLIAVRFCRLGSSFFCESTVIVPVQGFSRSRAGLFRFSNIQTRNSSHSRSQVKRLTYLVYQNLTKFGNQKVDKYGRFTIRRRTVIKERLCITSVAAGIV